VGGTLEQASEPSFEADEGYVEFCEEIWCDWLDDKLSVSDFVRGVFDLNAAPEPYISLGSGSKRLVALTTNPGKTISHQTRAAVETGNGLLRKQFKYAEAAPKLGEYYETHLSGHARQRIAKLQKLASWTGYKGVLQVEACPFHSKSLPQKNTLLRQIAKDDLLRRYTKLLRAFLLDRPVVCVQAATTQASLRWETPNSCEWLTWLADIAGIDLDSTEFVPLVKKDSKTTAAAWVSKETVGKALVLMMGSNNLPADKGLRELSRALGNSEQSARASA
jgi:hypothetical protein